MPVEHAVLHASRSTKVPFSFLRIIPVRCPRARVYRLTGPGPAGSDSSAVECPRARTAMRMRALTDLTAFVERITSRISTSKERKVNELGPGVHPEPADRRVLLAPGFLASAPDRRRCRFLTMAGSTCRPRPGGPSPRPGRHRSAPLRPRPVAGVAAASALGLVFLVSEVIGDLTLQGGLKDSCGQPWIAGAAAQPAFKWISSEFN